ncbi:MacB family efflux pump subunit [Bradyrhizobium sp. INPA01-394B]|uniref:Pyoverdine export ATP-binding/permease protein PvdT n=1 Tax=Bradyrhizobium campsiandrae TaxID=1729892 RepID=A0ABR7U003_9BRAD|nr:MacB family efflux pump subunit [Bradyrhizobium campsiandrae]MBC9877312.1 MacB family efflux pump subunit [Bradyrhizobium campsiandrae]MBC9976602.1 MacB family efflux pump subunit [Bradyrhizobium campsiandrae]
MADPIIGLEKVRREFATGEASVVALDEVSLSIQRGEMVAIIGSSGSGKSTLLNILGCLDRPTSGTYRVAGQDVSELDADALAALRREHFGFIFQRYHLLGDISAGENVEIPAIYAGMKACERRARAEQLLARLGVNDRRGHRPNQLSGGQQQRVSIARALINGAEVILADEPTGALDRRSGEEVLKILNELQREGRTIIIVTHDADVAARAERIIELRDGKVVSDRRAGAASAAEPAIPLSRTSWTNGTGWSGAVLRLREASRMALVAMAAHRMRAFLTMLGIIIGIAAVSSVVALGNASQRKVLSDISSLGTNTIEVFPGKDFGDARAGKIKTLVLDDARALDRQDFIAGVTPTVSTSTTVRYRGSESNVLVNGVGGSYFQVKGAKLARGRLFDADAIRNIERQAVIDDNTRKTFFADDQTSGIGRVIWLGKVPCRIVGVIAQQQGGFGSNQNLSVYLPYTTVQAQFTGDPSLRSILLRISDDVSTNLAQDAVTTLLTQRHNTRDFVILNTDDIRRTITSTTQTLAFLVTAIAVISLVVGGIGVMNIMLVSVSERISEIGVRMAVGARRSDILQQFLAEATLISSIGGIAGILVAMLLGLVINLAVPGFQVSYSTFSIGAAFLTSTGIGVAFGFFPARRAAFLDPVVALSRD